MIPKLKNDSNNFIRWRFGLLCSCILMSLFGLLARVAWLQVIEPDPLVKEEDMRSVRVMATPNTRGMITDRNGHPLAVSVPVEAIWADAKIVVEKGGVGTTERWQALAQELNMPMDQLINRINQNPNARFIYLARQVEPNVAEYIQRLKLPGIATKAESRRFYPSGDVAANLIGFTNIDDQGIEGVEKSFNSLLSGTAGSRVVRKDRFGRVVEDISSTDSHPGQNVELSIDERLQAEASHALTNAVMFNKADSGSAVVIDVNTGEILAMANYPTFNPNNRVGTPEENFRNRAISDIFEPGSTVKPMVVMTALQLHLVRPDSVLDTHPYVLSGHQIKDVGFYPALSLTGVLQKSSDVGVSRLALAMPASALMETYTLFGLGQPTQLGLTGESSGLMPHRQRWSDLDRATFSFGYGLMVTPLQLARVYATIGSFGIYRPLSITKVDPPVFGPRVLPEVLVRQVEHMMESVALPGGGGVKAPASQPRFALVVVINNPQGGKYYGGAVSAPVFSDIMGQILRTMNVEPDAIPTGIVGHS